MEDCSLDIHKHSGSFQRVEILCKLSIINIINKIGKHNYSNFEHTGYNAPKPDEQKFWTNVWLQCLIKWLSLLYCHQSISYEQMHKGKGWQYRTRNVKLGFSSRKHGNKMTLNMSKVCTDTSYQLYKIDITSSGYIYIWLHI